MNSKLWFSALALAASLSPALSAVVITLPADGANSVWIEDAKGAVLAGPAEVEGAKATLDTGAAKNAGEWTAVAEGVASGNVAMAKIPKGDAPRLTLTKKDFNRIGRVRVTVTDKDGHFPTYAAVTLTDGAGGKHTVTLRPDDAGEALFLNVAAGDGSIRVLQKEPENQQTVTVRLPLERETATLALAADVSLPDGMATQEAAASTEKAGDAATAPAGASPASSMLNRLLGFIVTLIILGGLGFLILRTLRAQGVTAQSALARAGIPLPGDDTPVATTVGEEAPRMVDPNVCPFCGGPKEPGGPCPNCAVDARGGAQTFTPASGGGKRLVALAGPRAGQVYPLEAPLSIGRETGRDVSISEDPALSRHHATVDPSGPETTITDEGSSNGSWVNGRRVQRESLRAGDEITLGASRFRYEE